MYVFNVTTKMMWKELTNLVRVRQWYKNVVVFLAIFFSGNLFDAGLLATSLLAFFSLCFISSAGYIINDLIDLTHDRAHPEKQKRPLASGKIKKEEAIIFTGVLFLAGFSLALVVGTLFFYAVFFLFLLSLLYTLFLKKIVLADVLTIASLFVLRAVGGAIAIAVVISPWLILGPFFLSLFLSIGKRHADILLMKEKAGTTRTVLNDYTLRLTNSLMVMATTLLLISYALYSFLSTYNFLIYTIPFALYVIFRFFYLIEQGSVISRHPEKVIKDKPMIVGVLLWVIITGVIIYG